MDPPQYSPQKEQWSRSFFLGQYDEGSGEEGKSKPHSLLKNRARSHSRRRRRRLARKQNQLQGRTASERRKSWGDGFIGENRLQSINGHHISSVPNWKAEKRCPPFQYQVRTMVQRRERRNGGIFSHKYKSRRQKGWRKRNRLSWRNSESRNCNFNLLQECRRRKFSTLQELTRNG